MERTNFLVPDEPGSLDTHLRIYRGKRVTHRCMAQFMYLVTAETPQPGQERHIHLCSYRGNLVTPAGKAHSFTQLLYKPEEYVCIYV
jgi:hypothetical protein